MLAFIVPFKPKIATHDWNLDNELLQRTLHSICQQENQDFKIYLCCTDEPSFSINHPKIQIIFFKGDRLNAEEIETHVFKDNKKTLVALMDKGRKVHSTIEQAIIDGCSYVMVVDSDDCVSRKLSKFVKEKSFRGNPGYYIEKGFVYQEGRNYAIKKISKFEQINGSTHIINIDLIPKPDPNSRTYGHFNFFTDHGYLRSRIRKKFAKELSPLPFYGAIYVAHDTNDSNISQINQSITLKRMVEKVLLRRHLTNAFKSEFGLYKLKG